MEVEGQVDSGVVLAVVGDEAVYGQVQLPNQEPVVPYSASASRISRMAACASGRSVE